LTCPRRKEKKGKGKEEDGAAHLDQCWGLYEVVGGEEKKRFISLILGKGETRLTPPPRKKVLRLGCFRRRGGGRKEGSGGRRFLLRRERKERQSRRLPCRFRNVKTRFSAQSGRSTKEKKRHLSTSLSSGRGAEVSKGREWGDTIVQESNEKGGEKEFGGVYLLPFTGGKKKGGGGRGRGLCRVRGRIGEGLRSKRGGGGKKREKPSRPPLRRRLEGMAPHLTP